MPPTHSLRWRPRTQYEGLPVKQTDEAQRGLIPEGSEREAGLLQQERDQGRNDDKVKNT